MPANKHLLVIAGPTAVGKTALSIRLAKHFGTEIISADSRQLYKEMSIGTAKPSLAGQQGVKHHLLDCISIHDPFSAADFEKEALSILDDLFTRHELVILCGGTGLYIDAVCRGFDEGLLTDAKLKAEIEEGYRAKGLAWLQDEVSKADPAYFASADTSNPRRLMRALEVIRLSGQAYSSLRRQKAAQRNFSVIKVLLTDERQSLYARIDARVDRMMEQGLLDEARALYPKKNLNALNTVGYKELFEHFDGKHDLDTAVARIKQHTRNYAKRQLTWFRKDKEYETFLPDDFEKIKAYVEVILQHS
jgi:tRNA dimethylallyltransferase